MAKYLTQEDLSLPLQASACTTLPFRVEVLDDLTGAQVGTIEGVVSGTVSMTADSEVRRTANLVVQPTCVEHIKLEEDNLLWLNKDVRLYVGLWNFRTGDYKYYPMGTYVYTDISNTYDATTNQLTINCADFIKKLDGTKNGQWGTASKLQYPAYLEDEETGEVIQHYYIRDAVVKTLKTLARITDYQVDEIGEYYALPEHNKSWKTYRENNPQWNCIPYDQEFSTGTTVLNILTTLTNLYPSYERFFDLETNTFIIQQIPTMYNDDIFLDNDYLQKVLISENKTVDMTTVRNICEVWGQTFEPDFFASEGVKYSSNTYSATIEGYDEKYYNGDMIAMTIPATNTTAGFKININNFGAIPVLDESDESPIAKGSVEKNKVYCFKIKKNRVDGEDVIKAYLLGQWQVHALAVLTDGTESNTVMTDSDGGKHKLYSESYFKKWYNVESIEFMTVPDSPFTVQKLGEIVDVKTGSEYENITSDALALDRAHWENWKNARLTDNITITTALLPWLDVNRKVSYRPQDESETHQYIIKSVSHDFAGYTSTITMYRFYPLYEPGVGANNQDSNG